jgi:hypothetical protein
MSYPKVSFVLDAKVDVSAFFCFVGDAQYDGGQGLGWAVFQKYPSFRKMFDGPVFTGKKTDIEEFVRKQYERYGAVVGKNLSLYEKNWRMKESRFYSLADELFPSGFWPKGKYVAYPTIWGMFPRFLDDKTFQVPCRWKNKRYVNVIVAHEMLHFIFYNYFFHKYPQYKGDEYEMLAWHVSEIFNAVVQNSPAWLKTFGLESMAYPEHESIVKKLSGEYRSQEGNRATDFLIERIVEEVEGVCLLS